MKPIDCRGLACPGPVIQVKKALEELPHGETVTVRVDSDASRENVSRFVESRGGTVRVEEEGERGWLITIIAPQDTGTRGHGDKETGTGRGNAEKPPVVFIAGDTIGTGDDKLGRILMEGFLNSLAEQVNTPDKLLLMNGGVRLAAEGSTVLDALEKLTNRGCEILACGTCLDFFDLKEKLAVGTVSNMYDMQQAMLTASKVIRP
ncbi:MAG: sulfurtransferase-like selenium metabolism protein YedF [bacterium]|nr:sulfurtransferase-like selenium metabolism protein YedF [bacterium]